MLMTTMTMTMAMTTLSWKPLLLLTLLAATSSNLFALVRGDEVPMIVGGKDVDPREYPYFVQVVSAGCGGALIAPDIVLTAAHCGNVQNTNMKIGAYKRDDNSGGAAIRTCVQYEKHPKYDGPSADYDFALCKLNQPVFIPANEPQLVLNERRSVPASNEQVVAIGMGLLAWQGNVGDTLRDVTIPVKTCDVYGFNNAIKICAGAPLKGICEGDSGGPLVRIQGNVHTHIGVTSGTAECETIAGSHGFFARTSAGMDWIRDTACNKMNSDSLCDAPTEAPTEWICENDRSFRFNNDIDKNCNWIGRNPKRAANYCPRESNGELVSRSCGEACGECCKDDEAYRFDNDDDKSCDWIGMNPQRVANYCPRSRNGELVSESCPKTCGQCCADDVFFHLDGEPTRGCLWIGKNSARVGTYCPQTSNGKLISQWCPKACGECCKDDESFLYRDTDRDCAWVGKNPTRTKRYCARKSNGVLVSESCPRTCGVC